MDIELITTKRKLTLPIIKQMNTCPFSNLEKSELMGYINANIGKKWYSIGLVKIDNDYEIFYLNWQKGETSIYRSAGIGSITIPYDTEDKCLTAWVQYTKALSFVLKKHIYL